MFYDFHTGKNPKLFFIIINAERESNSEVVHKYFMIFIQKNPQTFFIVKSDMKTSPRL